MHLVAFVPVVGSVSLILSQRMFYDVSRADVVGECSILSLFGDKNLVFCASNLSQLRERILVDSVGRHPEKEAQHKRKL